MYERILVALDRSEHAERALQTAVKLAKTTGAKLFGVHVVEQIAAAYLPAGMVIGVPVTEPVEIVEAERAVQQAAETYIRDVADRVEGLGVPIEVHLRHGSPAAEINAEAEARNVDLVVMGRSGLGAVASFFLGGVSQKVVAHTHRSVLLVE